MANKMVDIFQAQRRLFILGLEPYHNIARDMADNFNHGLNMNHPPPTGYPSGNKPWWARAPSQFKQGSKKGDGLFIITGEYGQSAESLIKESKEKAVFTFAFSSYPPLKAHRPDLLFYLPVVNRPRVKELFLMLGHIICTLVESTFSEIVFRTKKSPFQGFYIIRVR